MYQLGFLEFQTPILTSSSPEGATGAGTVGGLYSHNRGVDKHGLARAVQFCVGFPFPQAWMLESSLTPKKRITTGFSSDEVLFIFGAFSDIFCARWNLHDLTKWLLNLWSAAEVSRGSLEPARLNEGRRMLQLLRPDALPSYAEDAMLGPELGFFSQH